MQTVSVITIGYYNYVVDDDFLPALITAITQGKIKSAEKKYLDGMHKVVIGKRIDVQTEHLDVISDREAEMASLKERLKKLEQG